LDARHKRLLFQSRHRGMQENDLLLGGFAEGNMATLDDAGLDSFERLLDEGDNDLFNWISGKEPVPASFDDELMARLKDFRNSLVSS
jgi:antitoxin CptB